MAMLACKTLSGGGTAPDQPPPPIDNPTEVNSAPPADVTEAPTDSGSSSDGTSNFPMTDDATDVINAPDTVNYQTSLSLDEVAKFYRDYYTSKGYTERTDYSMTTTGVVSLAFDGDPSGKAVVISAVDIGNGKVTVTIYLQNL